MIAKTDAVVLRVAPFSRTSHVVTWLTREYGRISTVVKGAVRPKSAFLGQYDLFYSCELLFYERERNGLHVAKECSPLKLRPGLRREWRAYACAAYICDLVYQSSLAGERHLDGVFELLTEVLDWLASGAAEARGISADRDARSRGRGAPVGPGRGELGVVLHWFELRLLQVLGYAPHVERCVGCGVALGQRRSGFDAAHGGAFCLDCLSHPVPRHVVTVGPDTQALLRRWSGPDALTLLRNTVVSPKQLLALRDLAGTMLAYCLETRPESRDVAMATLRAGGVDYV
ncbi:MAG: DNA repair protein RecO [Verrucomicrobia bacterium]|nr:DNA repair protein RecO [Verrucomicrobiota bacterium]